MATNRKGTSHYKKKVYGGGKLLKCQHRFEATPVPRRGDFVLCIQCDDYRLVL